MIKTILLAPTLVIVLTMTVVYPVIADPIVGIKKTNINANESRINKLQFKLKRKVPKQPFGGYAIFTDGGSVIAITSHAGFFDSERQTRPSESQVVLQVGAHAAVCNVSKIACGPEWHVHLVEPVDNEYCDFKAVGELTHTEPSNWLDIGKKKIIARSIDIDDEKFKDSIGGAFRDFTVGAPIEGGVAFNLVPKFEYPGDINTLQAICIVPMADESDTDDDEK